jgi:hypothetical protein
MYSEMEAERVADVEPEVALSMRRLKLSALTFEMIQVSFCLFCFCVFVGFAEMILKHIFGRRIVSN